MLSGIGAEGPSGITRAPEEDIASFIVASTWACGISEVAPAKASPGTPGVGAAATACAAAPSAAPSAAGIVVAASRVAPAAYAAAPDGGGGGVSGGGEELDPLVGPVRGGVGGGREESWAVNPTFIVVNIFLDLLDDVVEGTDGPGEVIRVKFGDCSILGGTLVGVVFCRFDEPTNNLSERRAMYVGRRGIFPAWSLNQSLVFLLVTRLKRVMMQL